MVTDRTGMCSYYFEIIRLAGVLQRYRLRRPSLCLRKSQAFNLGPETKRPCWLGYSCYLHEKHYIDAVMYTALLLVTGNRRAGTPFTLTAVSRPDAALPDYARLVGAESRPGSSRVHDKIDRRMHRRDFYTPTIPPDWQAGDPVAVLEENQTAVGEDPTGPSPLGPLEGTLERVPGRMLEEPGQDGAPVVGQPGATQGVSWAESYQAPT